MALKFSFKLIFLKCPDIFDSVIKTASQGSDVTACMAEKNALSLLILPMI